MYTQRAVEDTGVAARLEVYGLSYSPSAVQVHYIHRSSGPPPPGGGGGAANATSGAMAVAELAALKNAVHAAAWASPACGFDVWFDNHIGLAWSSASVTLATLAQSLCTRGARWHLWDNPGSVHVAEGVWNPVIYAVEVRAFRACVPTRKRTRGEGGR